MVRTASTASYAESVIDVKGMRVLTDSIEEWNRTGRVPVDLLHEDAVWVPPREDPDFIIYRGHDEIVRYSESWREIFDEIRWEILDVVTAGNRALVRVKQTGIGKASGVSVEMEESIVYTYRDGKISRAEEYSDSAIARRAAGIEESG